MRTLLFAAMLIGVGSPAWAGCGSWGPDGNLGPVGPRVETCFDGLCEQTTLLYSCGNVYGSQVGYANGWKAAFSTGDDNDVSTEGDNEHAIWQPDGSQVPEQDHHKFVCRPVDDTLDGCG